MNKFWAVFRVSFRYLVYSLGFQGRKKKARDTSGWLVLGLVLGLNLLLGVIYGLPMGVLFAQMGRPQLVLAVMGMMATALCTAFTVVGAKDVVFGTKDMDIMLSLPLSGAQLLAARLGALYLENAAITFVWTACAGLGWVVSGGALGVWFVLALLLGGVLLAALPTTLALLFGFVMAAVSGWCTRRALAENLMYLAGTVLLCAVMLGMNTPTFYQTGEIGAWAAPFVWLADGCLGDAAGLAKLAVLAVVPLLAAGIACGCFYGSVLAALTQRRGKSDYRLGRLESGTARRALVKKEWQRWVNTPIYLFNAGIGLLLYLGASVAVVVQRDQVMELLASEGLDQLPLLAVAAGFSAFVLGMTTITASAVSLEGRNFWVLRSLPLSGREILWAKALFHYLVCLPFVLLCSLLLGVGGRLGLADTAVLLLLCLCYNWYVALAGLLINLRWPKLDAVNDTVVVKQSAAVGTALLADFGLMLLGGAAWWLTGTLGCLAVVLLAGAVVTWLLWSRGEAMLEAIAL